MKLKDNLPYELKSICVHQVLTSGRKYLKETQLIIIDSYDV